MYIANIYSVYIERTLVKWRLRFYCLRNLISSNSYVYLELTCSSSQREHREILTKLTAQIFNYVIHILWLSKPPIQQFLIYNSKNCAEKIKLKKLSFLSVTQKTFCTNNVSGWAYVLSLNVQASTCLTMHGNDNEWEISSYFFLNCTSCNLTYLLVV